MTQKTSSPKTLDLIKTKNKALKIEKKLKGLLTLAFAGKVIYYSSGIASIGLISYSIWEHGVLALGFLIFAAFLILGLVNIYIDERLKLAYANAVIMENELKDKWVIWRRDLPIDGDEEKKVVLK